MTLGARGERAAARFLKRRGFRILHRNFWCSAGEIDLVARDGDMLVFVEVKTRRSDSLTHPEVNVTYAKQRQVVRVAQYFLMRHRENNPPCRFDVLAVVLRRWRFPEIEHFVDAFQA